MSEGLTTRSTLPNQLWMTPGEEGEEEPDPPTEEEYTPVSGNRLHCKPYGGFWTSTFTPDAEYDSDWIRWCSSEGFHAGRETFRLAVESDLRIVEVDTLSDLRNVLERYENDAEPYVNIPHEQALDFEALAEDFDGMRLTAEGQVKTRMPGMSQPNLYGWDSECTLWFSWSFEDVEYVGTCENELPNWS